MSEAVKGLDKQQALLALSTAKVNLIDQAKILENAKIISSTEAKIMVTEADKAATDADTASKYANLKVTNLLKVAWAKFTGFIKANPWAIAITAGVVAITGMVKYLDSLNKAQERAKETTEEYLSEIETLETEISSLESKLEEYKKQIDSLDPITDAEDIQNLKLETTELNSQLAILKEKERLAKESASNSAKEYFNTKSGSKYDVNNQQQYTVTDGSNTINLVNPVNIGIPKDVLPYEELALATEKLKYYNDTINDTKEQLLEIEKINPKFLENEDYIAKSKELEELEKSMQTVREDAVALANDCQTQANALDETDIETKELKETVNGIIGTYTDVISVIDATTDALNNNAEAQDQEPSEKWSFKETITQLDAAKEALSTLDETYTKLFDGDKDTNIGFDDFSAINEAFSNVTDIDNYIQRLQQAGQNTEQVKAVMEDLIGAYLEQSNVLDNVTDENKELIISMLQEMGIMNAEEIVLAQLSHQTEMLAVQKQFATEKGYELANATVAEANEFINEANCSDITRQALAQLALEKINVNEQKIDTASDIDNVIALANAALASETALVKLQKAKSVLAAVESAGTRERAGVSEKGYLEALKVVEQIENGTFDYDFQTIDPNKYKVSGGIKYSPQSVSGTKTYDAVKDASDSAKNEFKETIDFFETGIKKLDDSLSLLEASVENVTGAFAKNELISAQIDLNAQKMNGYASALEMYSQKANEALSGIPEELRDKVVNGAVNITTFEGEGNEAVVDAINDYNDWADKIAECSQQLVELKNTIRDLMALKFSNIKEDFSNQFDIRDNTKSLIDKQISLLEEMDSIDYGGFYKAQISQTGQQLEILNKEKQALTEQMNESVTSGWVKLCPIT